MHGIYFFFEERFPSNLLYSRPTTFRKCFISTSMTAHNHCLMYSNEWCTLRTSVGARQARSMNHSRANNKYFARKIRNRFLWNWINAKNIEQVLFYWTKTKTSRMSRCKSGAEHARWITSQCSMPLAIFSLFLLSKLVGNYIDENSGPMHVPHAGWITARQSRPYRIKESFHIVGCKVDSPRSMHWFAKIHCSDWQLHPCCRLWQLLPK